MKLTWEYDRPWFPTTPELPAMAPPQRQPGVLVSPPRSWIFAEVTVDPDAHQ